MIGKMKHFKLFFILLIMIAGGVEGQYAIRYPEWYPAQKFQHLYVLSKDTTSENSRNVFRIIKESWNLCPVSFFQGRGIDVPQGMLVKGNLFIDMGTNSTEYTFMRDVGTGATVSNDYYHLDLWTIRDVYDASLPQSKSTFTVATAELYNKEIGMGGVSYKNGGDFTSVYFRDDFCNGMNGNIKNMIQFLNEHIKQNETRKLLQDMQPSQELANLAKETLYIPNYWYGSHGTMIENESVNAGAYRKTAKYIDEVVASYPYKAQLVSRDLLDSLILNANKNVYYLNYIQSSADKIISVVNGLNGNLIYSEITRKSYKIKNDDLIKLGSAIH
jgi:hypothetical protein